MTDKKGASWTQEEDSILIKELEECDPCVQLAYRNTSLLTGRTLSSVIGRHWALKKKKEREAFREELKKRKKVLY